MEYLEKFPNKQLMFSMFIPGSLEGRHSSETRAGGEEDEPGVDETEALSQFEDAGQLSRVRFDSGHGFPEQANHSSLKEFRNRDPFPRLDFNHSSFYSIHELLDP
jgi:hypothetical protein